MGNGKPEEPIPSSCLLGHDNQRRISTLERDHDDLKADMKAVETGIWTEIGRLRDKLDRLPAWASLTMTGLGVVAGAAVGVVVTKAFS